MRSEVLRKSRKALRILPNARWRAGLVRGIAATIEHAELPLRDDYLTVIDVGANRGQFVLFALVRFPDAKIIAYEPLSAEHDRLVRFLRGDPRVDLRHQAVGSAKGTAVLNVSNRSDSSSLLSPLKSQEDVFASRVVRTEQVDVVRLDDAITIGRLGRPILLKLDVQGFELEVLRGAEQLLRCVHSVLVEASLFPFYEGQALFADVYDYLAARSFRLTGGRPSAVGKDGRWLQGDWVFESCQ